ncbi:MAG: hypothetical protein DRN71_03270 [Candidatus Nanohalarchaeota archaeon]|nr:MAG: hypothetical protein DRN71_03270 [Candidatus Nanohaloarchaeota archaeon]
MTDIEEIINQIESDECPMIEDTLHKLLELAVTVTGLGEMDDGDSKTITFPLSAITITSDSYYQRFFFGEDILIEDNETIEALAQEIKKRLLKFDKQIKKTRTELAEEIFSEPIGQIPELAGMEITDFDIDIDEEDEEKEKEVE